MKKVLIEFIAEFPGFKFNLQPHELAGVKRNKWDLGRCRTLPKDSNPAAAHRPLCDRSEFLTARLDSVSCRAGVWDLKALDVSEHSDIDNPEDVISGISKLVDRSRKVSRCSNHFIVLDQSDMKGCFTNIQCREAIQAIRYIVDEWKRLGLNVIHIHPNKKSGYHHSGMDGVQEAG